MKTREEVELLKQQWKDDPVWDLESTEEFHEYFAELQEFAEKCRAEWEQEYERKLQADLLYLAQGDVSAEQSQAFALIDIGRSLRRIVTILEDWRDRDGSWNPARDD